MFWTQFVVGVEFNVLDAKVSQLSTLFSVASVCLLVLSFLSDILMPADQELISKYNALLFLAHHQF